MRRLARRPSRRRRIPALVAVPAASLLILTLGFCGLWTFARSAAGSVIDEWTAREGQRGRIWACPQREIAGFPFRIEIACAGPSFRGKVGGTQVDVRLGGFRAVTYLTEPSTVAVSVVGPLTARSQDGHLDAVLDWTRLEVTLRGLTAGLSRAALDMDRPVLTSKDGGGRADRLDIHIGPAPGRPIEDLADEVRVAIDKAEVPAFDALARSSDPAVASLNGVVTRVGRPDFPSASEAEPELEPGPAMIEQWRRQGGQFEVASLELSKGTLHVGATGLLRVDEAHRVAGELQTRLAGAEPLAEQLGVPARALAVGNVLAGLLGHKGVPPASAPSPDRPELDLQVGFADGHVTVGPFRTGVRLQPLY